MRDIIDKDDLEQVRRQGVGFILNVRDEILTLHYAWCDYAGVMYPPKFQKKLFETREEAMRWLATSALDWKSCGHCRNGLRPEPATSC